MGYLSYHKSVHARGVVVDIQVVEDEKNCVCVHLTVHRPVFCLHALSQSFICVLGLVSSCSSLQWLPCVLPCLISWDLPFFFFF